MKIFYTKKFSKDLDKISNDLSLQKNILVIIDLVKQANTIFELTNIKKIQGYNDYYRMRLGDYRLGKSIQKMV
jgi:mRNA interferase RelE/StbE